MTAAQEFWTCPVCADVFTSEQKALDCHPVYHAWTCSACGDVWESRAVAEACCTGDDDQ